MDVEKVLGLLHGFFDQEQEPLVVVGGLAMLTYGATRNTYDCAHSMPRGGFRRRRSRRS